MKAPFSTQGRKGGKGPKEKKNRDHNKRHVFGAAGGGGDRGGRSRYTREGGARGARTGGRFFEARDGAALSAVYADIDALERSPFERPAVEVEERFAPLLLAAMALLLAARLLRSTVLEVLP